MIKNEIQDTIIIGSGCAGLSAAIYASRAELKTVVFAGNLDHKGGLLVKTSIVENYPGFENGILGVELVLEMEKQAKKYGAVVIDEDVLQIKVDSTQTPNIFEVIDAKNNSHFTKTLIIATGSTPNKLGLEREELLWANGISSCAVCDGALFRRKKIVVVGGGDSALEEASFLTKFSDVLLIHRRDTFRGSKIMQQKVLNNPKIKILYHSVIEKLIGETKLTSILVKNVQTNVVQEIPVDGLFYGLGLTPNSKIFQGLIEIGESGYIKKFVRDECETLTSKEGIFVAGDVADSVYRQAIVAAGSGCQAALDVDKYLKLHFN